MTTATIPQQLSLVSELDLLRRIAAGGPLGATFDTYEELRAASQLTRSGLAAMRDVLGIGVASFVLTDAGRQRLQAADAAPRAVAFRHWRVARVALENLAHAEATGHLYDLWAAWRDERETIGALLDGGYIVRRGALRRRGVNPERYAITDAGRQLLDELRRIRPATPRPTPRRTLTVGRCKVEIYDVQGYAVPRYHVTIYIRRAGIWYAAGAFADFSRIRAFRQARRYLQVHRWNEALEDFTEQQQAIVDTIARGYHNKVDIRLMTPFDRVSGGLYTWLEEARYTHIVETAPDWYEIAPVMPTRALVPVQQSRALVVAGHFPPVPQPAPQSEPEPEPAPRAPFSSENVKIAAGRWDAGAFHRAIEIARALYEGGRWHGQGTLFVKYPYTTHRKLAAADYDAAALVVDEDYYVELF